MRLRRVMLPLAVVVTLSCGALEGPDAGAIALYLDLSSTTVPLNGSIDARVTARNVGTQRLTLTGPSDCLLYIEVLGSSGQRLYTSAFQCTGSTVTEELAPGVDKVVTVTWDGTTNGGARLASGTYHLRPVALVTGGAYAQPGASIRVE